jgi:homogentisate 1,2-dioxygenase
MFPQNKGGAPRQAHVGIPAGLYEEEYGRNGFFGRATHLYHENPPTGWVRIEGPLRHHAYRACDLVPADLADVRGMPATLLENADVAMRISRRSEPMPFYYRNADSDDVYFVHRGEGRIETDFGPVNFEAGDYVVIPRGITYRVVPATRDNLFLVIESQSEIRLPEKGMLGHHALFDPGVIRTPDPSPSRDRGEFEVLVRREGQYTSVFYPFNPLDVAAWKGDATVWQVNVRDIRPVVSPRYHLPPSVHTTFLGHNFVICTFLPRPLETEDSEALRVPFYHRNIDFDEVIFYHDGEFFSRDGIKAGWVTFHPQGIHHGPHPKAVEASRTKERTNETAVMLDTRRPLRPAIGAPEVEWADYTMSWARRESGSPTA